MKRLIWLILLIAVLSGCGITAESEPQDTSWRESYAVLLMEPEFSSDRIAFVELQDLNFDGIPELLPYSLGLANTWCFNILEWRDGEIISHDYNDFVISPLTYCTRVDTGESVWLEELYNRSGYGEYYYTIREISFDTFSDPTGTEVFSAFQHADPDAELESDPSLYLIDGEEYDYPAFNILYQEALQPYNIPETQPTIRLWADNFDEAEDAFAQWVPVP